MPYEILAHTADIRMRVQAQSLPGLFEDALLGMFDIVAGKKGGETLSLAQRITVKSQDKTALLVDFLNKALALSHTHRVVYREVQFIHLSAQSLYAALKGFAVEAFDKDIKAVTYHEAEVRQNEKGEWETMLIFDI